MPTRDLVVVGASAGGVEALRALVADLPADFPAAVAVCLHVPARGGSALAAILGRAGQLPASNAMDGERLRPGHIYVAPPDRHLLIREGRAVLSAGPRENGHRPAVDALFRSAAVARGPLAVGVVLSGALDDGTAGALALRALGGVTVAQDPKQALHASMPLSAIEGGRVEHVLGVEQMAELLVRLCTEEVDVSTAPEPSATMVVETDMAAMTPAAFDATDRPGTPAGLGCPDCSGALWKIEEGGLFRFRCRVGHAWSPDSLLNAQGHDTEYALWMALRALEDKAALCTQLAGSARDRDRPISAEHFDASAGQAAAAAQEIRRLLETVAAPVASAPEELAVAGNGRAVH